MDEIRCLLREANNGSQKTLSDLHKHAQYFLVTIHVPSPLTFLQMSLRFLYTNVGRLLFFNLDNLASSPGSSRFRLLLSCRRPIGQREDPGDEVDVTHGSQWRSIEKKQ